MKPGNQSAGRPPQKPSAKIFKVEMLDEMGNPTVPPNYEYWVIEVSSLLPVVLQTSHSFAAAFNWLEQKGYQLQP